MKIAIDMGHCLKGYDTSADGRSAGGFLESDYDRLLGKEIIKLLEQEGHTVVNVTVDDGTVYSNMYGSLAARTSKANANNVDLYFAIHFNAGGGKGTEIYYAAGDTTEPLCQRVQNKMVALGFTNRGVKNENFYVLVNAKMPAALIETCFCDSASDKALYDKLGHATVAKAIVEGILNKTIEVKKEENGVNRSMYLFSKNWYLYRYPDIAKSCYKDDPYVHYAQYGKNEGRMPIPPIPSDYREEDYLALNPDVAKAIKEGQFNSGIEHYIQYGFKENREVCREVYSMAGKINMRIKYKEGSTGKVSKWTKWYNMDKTTCDPYKNFVAMEIATDLPLRWEVLIDGQWVATQGSGVVEAPGYTINGFRAKLTEGTGKVFYWVSSPGDTPGYEWWANNCKTNMGSAVCQNNNGVSPINAIKVRLG